ncbi:unnamed protein product [Cunninghamella blakesleeana]
MVDIFKKATYILAVLDLHKHYLMELEINEETIGFIKKYRNILHKGIKQHTIIQIIKDKIIKGNKEKIQAFEFLVYLLNVWSNHAWHSLKANTIFPYNFDWYHKNWISLCDMKNNSKYNKFLKLQFTQHYQIYLQMILNSAATKKEDRFHAILPIWDKHHYPIKDKNTVPNWNITRFRSVILKLYEIASNNDLWNKARLLYVCSHFYSTCFYYPTFCPSFATYYRRDSLKLDEIGNLGVKYKHYNFKVFIKPYH